MQTLVNLALPNINVPHLLYDIHNLGKVSESQCDCACALSSQSVSRSSSRSIKAPYALGNVSSLVPLTNNYYIALIQQAPVPIVLNQHALALANHFNQARPLTDIPLHWQDTWGQTIVQSALEQMVSVGLLVSHDCALPSISISETPTTLSAWLHITDHCNLRCSYCYLPHNPVDMSVETGKAAIDATFRSAITHNYQKVKLKYAGGEAMLRFSFIADLHHYAQKLANQHHLALDGVVLSNGTRLTSEIIETMQALDLRLMISLDGLGDVHDSQRPYANGRGSSEDVIRAVDLALAHGLAPDISVTISSRNAAGLPELVAWILDRDLPFSLNFYRENDFSAPYESLKLEEEKIINGMLAAFKIIETNLPRRSLLPSLVDRANLSAAHLRTCSVGDSYLVFDHLGQVSKCQMQLDKPVTTIKAKDPLALIRVDELGIQNIPVEEKEGCRDCEWRYWCAGGCSLATHRATGRYDVKSPNCNIYKTLYPEAARLEGLRLLKYADELSISKFIHGQ